ncbi:protein Aster-B-like [Montipora foliosa]|uniref:protein Aster-B-like n=1 Tax=Montipora foliosa TaxID=591990 RepID=UPI0035F17E97
MEERVSSNISDTVNIKENDAKKERPKSLHLENLIVENGEEISENTRLTRKTKEISSSQEDLSSRNADPELERQGITNTLKSKIRDLSPSRKSSNSNPVSKSERKTSKTKTPQRYPRSPANWLPASFNQIFSNYKSKCGDFRRLFKDLPDSEQLIVDYSCALQRDILVHGRLYVSQNWLCFYANIFGWETFVTIPCAEISSITKEKTALVIPNAILVCTESEKYFFASFISRDTTYTVLFRIWQNALLDQPLNPSELIQLVGKYSESCNGSSENYDSDEDDDDDDNDGNDPDQVSAETGSEGDNERELVEDVHSQSSLDQSQSSLATESVAPDDQSRLNRNGDLGPKVSVTPPSPGVTASTDHPNHALSPPEGEHVANGVNAADAQSHSRSTSPNLQLKNLLKSPMNKRNAALLDASVAQDRKESSDLEEEGTASEHEGEGLTDVPINCACDSHLSKECINEEFPVSVDTLYEYLFTESDFYRRIQKTRKTKDLVFNPWETTEDGQRRTLTYTIALNHPIGPKHSPTTEKQHCLQNSVPGKVYVVQAEVNNEGIPYGDSFYIINRYCITRTSKMTSRLRITSDVFYQKSVWGFVKNMIEKNALEGLRDYFQFLVESLRRETTEGHWPNKLKVAASRRHKRNRSLKQKEMVEPVTEVSMEAKTSFLQRLSLRTTVSRIVGVSRSHLPQGMVENPLPVFVTVLLGALLLLNMLLMYRLFILERATHSGMHWDGTIKDLPADAAQWSELLQQQKQMHEMEMKRWREVLASSIQLMSQVQYSLDLLQVEMSKEQTSGTMETT